METIGSRVREARKRARKTIEEVARESGCGYSAIAKLEQGTRDKVLIRFARLAKALDTTMEDLIPAEALALDTEDPDDDDVIPF
jgi:transcriptional regulator with XRE-family HTH domain